jgi:hypothetical protein
VRGWEDGWVWGGGGEEPVVRSEVGDGEGWVAGVVEEGSGAVEEEGEER